MADLSGVYAKFNRAQEHLVAAQRELVSFRQSNPYRLVTKPNADGTEYIIYIRDLRHPPIKLSVLVGDCLYNLRSALDHLVWQLVIANNKRPTSRNEFPIFTDRSRYNHTDTKGKPARGSGLEKILGVGPRAQAVIERLQPYNSVTPSSQPDVDQMLIRRHPLNILQEFANIDKHRVLHIVQTSATAAQVISSQLRFDVEAGLSTIGPLEDGAEVGRIRGPQPLHEMEVRFHPLIEEVLEEEWNFLPPVYMPLPSITERLHGLLAIVHEATQSLASFV